jgi:hypothetical protein
MDVLTRLRMPLTIGTFYGTLGLNLLGYVLVATPKKVPAIFYRTRMGAEPVRDWIKSLSGE